MLSNVIENIERIYSEFNIHKAIFVSFNYESTTKLFKRLQLRHFPISRIQCLDEVHKFNNHDSRILIMDYIDLSCIHILAKEYLINLKDIDFIIIIGNDNERNQYDKSFFAENLKILSI